MKSLFICLFHVFMLSSGAVISSPSLLNGSGIEITAANLSIAAPLDPRFKIRAYFDGPRLPFISCLMNTVKMLVKLGLEDFSGTIGKTSLASKDHPQVEIVVSPKVQGGTMAVGFAVWGLSHGATHMILEHRFQQVMFVLSWDGEEVGRVALVEQPPTTQHPNASIDTDSAQNLTQPPTLSLLQRPPNLLSKHVDNTALTAENSNMVLRASLFGPSVPVMDVFLLAIAVLVDVSPWPATQPLQTYDSPRISANVEIMFKEPVIPRTRPPFFQAQWLMEAMALIPEYMIRQGAFRETLALVEVDGVRVADGYLGMRGDEGRGLAMVRADNISVS